MSGVVTPDICTKIGKEHLAGLLELSQSVRGGPIPPLQCTLLPCPRNVHEST